MHTRTHEHTVHARTRARTHPHLHTRTPTCTLRSSPATLSAAQTHVEPLVLEAGGPPTTVAAKYDAQNLPDTASFPLGHTRVTRQPPRCSPERAVQQPEARAAAGPPGRACVGWAGPWKWTRASSFSRGSSRQLHRRPGFRGAGLPEALTPEPESQEEKGTLWARPAEARLPPPGSRASVVTTFVHSAELRHRPPLHESGVGTCERSGCGLPKAGDQQRITGQHRHSRRRAQRP